MSEVLGAEFSLFGDDHYLDFTTLPEPLDNFPTLAHDAEAKPDWDIFVKDSFPLSERRIAPLPRRSTTPPSSILPSIGFMSSAPSPCLSTPPLSFAPVIDPLLRPSTPAFYRLSSPDVQSSDSEYDDSTASVRARKRKLARRAAPSSKRTKPNASSRHGGLQRLFFPGSPMTSDTSSSSSAASSPSPCGSSSPSSLNPDGSGKFRCPEAGCTQVCKTSGDLRRHLQSLTHRAPAFPCDRCGKSFTREDALKRHRVNVRGCATAKR
ncbi:hypothetical protein BV25DRAFT_1160079 [Artomyces pyxidatus]|uniref:Uncharacterized protein n=1 Tax=Artomyces pyxidatus TaxID=48021 RepID=A0ACB8SSR9_9AGAM|nr:hypothetical protein BV25DRAFT_1160079 [Artomyces pyxidatus]